MKFLKSIRTEGRITAQVGGKWTERVRSGQWFDLSHTHTPFPKCSSQLEAVLGRRSLCLVNGLCRSLPPEAKGNFCNISFPVLLGTGAWPRVEFHSSPFSFIRRQFHAKYNTFATDFYLLF